MPRPILEAARAAQRLDAARRAIERLAESDPRLADSLRTVFGDDDPDRRAAAARRAVAIIARAADAKPLPPRNTTALRRNAGGAGE